MNAVVSRETRLANPWLWIGPGLGFCFVAALLALAGQGAGFVFAAIVTLGLLLCGIGLTIRLNSSAPVFVPVGVRPILTLALIGFQLLGVALVTWSLAAAFIGVDPISPSRTNFENPPPLRPGLAIVLWVLLAPMGIVAAFNTLKALPKRDDWPVALETASLLMASAFAAFLAGTSLAGSAPSLTMFLSVLTAFLSALVTFAALPSLWQKVQLSAAIVLHFAFIINATLAAPPTSWLMGQLWTRFSRPYLEFMYLNNAYHFYSPDPGPASLLWFRLYFDTGMKDPETGQTIYDAEWLKIPKLTPKGDHGYRVALEYQRHLSLTENVTQSEATPPLYVRGQDGRALPSPFFANRIHNSPDSSVLLAEVVGQPKPPFVMQVPFHQAIPNEQQFQKPTLATARTLESYVRHVAQTVHSTHPDWPLKFIRVYRVTHIIPPWMVYMNEMDPDDPEFYRPYYLGKYDTHGKLMEPEEPLLYWMLPILRDNPTLRQSPIRSYVHLHAGDPDFMYYPIRREWSEERKEAPK